MQFLTDMEEPVGAVVYPPFRHFLPSEALTGGPAPSLLYLELDGTRPFSLDIAIPVCIRHRIMSNSTSGAVAA